MLNIADQQRVVGKSLFKKLGGPFRSPLGHTRSDKRNSYHSLKGPDTGRNKINILKCIASAVEKYKKSFLVNISTVEGMFICGVRVVPKSLHFDCMKFFIYIS